MKFAELLQIQTDENQGMSYKATLLYFNWLKDRIANNVPMDQIVRELLTSTGGTFVNPSTNYYQVELRRLENHRKRSSSFHGHADSMRPMSQPSIRPVDPRRLLLFRFFLQSDRSQKSGRSSRIHNLQPQERRNQSPDPHNKPLPPKFLGGEAPEIKRGSDRRAVMADWLASPENPFARNLANISLGPLLREGNHRTSGRRPGIQSALQPTTARRTSQAIHRLQLRLQKTRSRRL